MNLVKKYNISNTKREILISVSLSPSLSPASLSLSPLSPHLVRVREGKKKGGGGFVGLGRMRIEKKNERENE